MYCYKYCVISFIDDGYSESYTTALFCEFSDAEPFYNNLLESGKPCMLYRLNKYDNLNL